MRKKFVQMSLLDTYKGVVSSLEEDKPKLFRMLDEYIDWDEIIPARFYAAFYQRTGRPREYPLEGFMKSLVLQRIFGYTDDSLLLVTLRHSKEMRDFCGFDKVLDAAKLTRFKQDFLPYIAEVLERLVDITEPICRAMDAALADSLIFDTTGIESHVVENNPKFMTAKLRQANAIAKTDPSFDPYKGVYGLLPYAKRVTVERSIGSFKAVLGLENRKTYNSATTKADLFLAGIVQPLCVVWPIAFTTASSPGVCVNSPLDSC